MTQNVHYDLIIIGAGSAGTQAALLAAKNKHKTLLIESGFIGGTCLNSGCVPTKYLLCSTAIKPALEAQTARNCASGHLNLSLAGIHAAKNAYLAQARTMLEQELIEAGVTYIKGKAQFLTPNTLSVTAQGNTQEFSFAHCLIATGSAPAAFPGLKPDGAKVIGSSSAINLKEAPKSLIIVGGGPIGLELGEFFSRMGSQITLVDKAPRLIAMEDPDISQTMLEHLQASGWNIQLGKNIVSVNTENDKAVLTLDSGDTFSADYALIAIGRRPNLAGLNHDAANVTLTANGYIQTDPYLKATESIYAAGDITARLMLANAAADQGKYVIRHLLGQQTTPYAPPFMPSCVYGTLEAMRVGPTVTQLLKEGKEVTIAKVPFSHNHIAAAFGSTTGFVKLAFVNDTLASIAAIGGNASELISYAALLLASGNTEADTLFAHTAWPALAEIIQAALHAPRINAI